MLVFGFSETGSRVLKRSISMSSEGWEQGRYLERMVQKKKFEVDALLRRHQDLDDPLVMRMGYMATEGKLWITESLKRDADGEEGLHTMSVLCDLKRRSPTIPTKRNIIEFDSASKFAEILTMAEVDGFLVNTGKSNIKRYIALYCWHLVSCGVVH